MIYGRVIEPLFTGECNVVMQCADARDHRQRRWRERIGLRAARIDRRDIKAER